MGFGLGLADMAELKSGEMKIDGRNGKVAKLNTVTEDQSTVKLDMRDTIFADLVSFNMNVSQYLYLICPMF